MGANHRGAYRRTLSHLVKTRRRRRNERWASGVLRASRPGHDGGRGVPTPSIGYDWRAVCWNGPAANRSRQVFTVFINLAFPGFCMSHIKDRVPRFSRLMAPVSMIENVIVYLVSLIPYHSVLELTIPFCLSQRFNCGDKRAVVFRSYLLSTCSARR